MASSSFQAGNKFTFDTSNGFIIYEIDLMRETYCKCKQITTDNEWPSTIYLSPDQLNHITPYTQQVNSIGTEFTMGTDSNTNYKIINVNAKQQHYECIEISSESQLISSPVIYLSFDQFEFVNVLKSSPSAPSTSGADSQEDFEHLSHVLPYFTDFIQRKEKSVLVLDQNKFKNDPSGYLKAIRAKYNIKHRRELSMNGMDDDDDDDDDGGLRPWIEGKMEKLMAQSGYFVREKWKTRLFRLFDEALVWFDDDSFLSKLKRKRSNKSKIRVGYDDNDYMTPFGVLPLAMITGLNTADINAMDGKISEDELLRLELQIGDEGVIILKCSDFNQRIKWYECLHSAIFAVQKPVFVKDKDLWRIAEPKPAKLETQLTKGDLSPTKKRGSIGHVKMGKSLAFKLNDMKNLFTPSTPQIDEEDELNDAFGKIELRNLENEQTNARVPSTSIEIDNDVKIL